jgi:hypothetical protein
MTNHNLMVSEGLREIRAKCTAETFPLCVDRYCTGRPDADARQCIDMCTEMAQAECRHRETISAVNTLTSALDHLRRDIAYLRRNLVGDATK